MRLLLDTQRAAVCLAVADRDLMRASTIRFGLSIRLGRRRWRYLSEITEWDRIRPKPIDRLDLRKRYR